MGLFDVDYVRQNLPEGDERAMDSLWQIDQIYSANAAVTTGDPKIRTRYRVSEEMKLFFIEMSVHIPHLLEEKLASEPTLPQLIDWATSIMSGLGDPSSTAIITYYDENYY